MMSRHAANPIYFNVKKEKKNKNWTFTKLVNLPPLLRPITSHFFLNTPPPPPLKVDVICVPSLKCENFHDQFLWVWKSFTLRLLIFYGLQWSNFNLQQKIRNVFVDVSGHAFLLSRYEIDVQEDITPKHDVNKN